MPSKVNAGRYYWHLDILFSIYVSFLFSWLEESRPFAWSNHMRNFYYWHPHAISLSRADIAYFYLELFLVPALVVFAVLRLMRHISFTPSLPRIIYGIVAIGGLPIAWLYHDRQRLILGMELVMATILLALWRHGKWPVSAAVNIFLLVLHCLFWSVAYWLSPSVVLRGEWEIQDYLWLMTPVLGFCCTMVWARCFSGRVAH